MISLLPLRRSNNATSVLSRCVSALSREQLRSEGSASAASAASAAVSSSFDLRQRRGIASRGIDDDAASRSTSHPAPTPDDFARVASGAAADVARVVNQLNMVRPFLFRSRMLTLFLDDDARLPSQPLSSSFTSLSLSVFTHHTMLSSTRAMKNRSSSNFSGLACRPGPLGEAVEEEEATATASAAAAAGAAAEASLLRLLLLLLRHRHRPLLARRRLLPENSSSSKPPPN